MLGCPVRRVLFALHHHCSANILAGEPKARAGNEALFLTSTQMPARLAGENSGDQRRNNPGGTGTEPRDGGTSAAPDGQGGRSRQQLHSGGMRLASTGATGLPAARERPASSSGAKAAIAAINRRRASWTMAGFCARSICDSSLVNRATLGAARALDGGEGFQHRPRQPCRQGRPENHQQGHQDDA